MRIFFNISALLAVAASGIVLHRDVQLATYYLVSAVAMKIASIDKG